MQRGGTLRQDMFCRCSYLCFQMPSNQADAWKSSWELGENRRNLIHLGYGIYQFDMGSLAALQLH